MHDTLSRLRRCALGSRALTLALIVIATLVYSGPAYAARGVEVVKAGVHPDQNDVAVTVVFATTPHTLCEGSMRVAIRGSTISRGLPPIKTSSKGDGLWEWRIDGKIPSARWKVSVDCHLAKQSRRVSSDSREFSAPAGHGRGSESAISVPGSLRGRAITLEGEKGGDGGGGANLYPHGQCTWYVATRRPDLPYFPGASGNALNWLVSAKKDGFRIGTAPLPGSVAVFQPNQYGAGKYGHVAYVEEVLPGQLIKVSEFNYSHHLAKDERNVSSKALHFIYEADTQGKSGSTIPVNTAQPSITGVTKVGRELTCTVGSWSGGPLIVYLVQWYRDGAAMALATAPTYLIQSADEGHVLGCVVTASTEAGSTKAPATNVVVYSLPSNTAPPVIEGTPTVGTTLTCTHGSWAGTPIEGYGYQWLLDEKPLIAADGPEFTPTRADEGEPLSCRVTAENPAGDTTAESKTYDIYQEPINTAPPQITGGVSGTEANVSETLSCEVGTWKGIPELSYSRQWFRGAEEISGATGERYEVQNADEGRLLACEVEATNTAGKDQLTSAGVRVSSMPRNTSPPKILGSGKVGEELTCGTGEWGAVPAATFSYRWRRDNASFEGASGEKYLVQAADEGHLLTCIVTAENMAGKVSIESENGIAVPEEARKLREEEERKEKEVIVSVDNTKGDRGPYDGVFERAWQKFTAKSNSITYAGVTIGNPSLPVGGTDLAIELRICSTQECTGSGAELGHAIVAIDNYGVSAGEFEREVEVVQGHIYYLVWAAPPKVAGTGWLAFWHGGSAIEIEFSEEMEAVVRGYDRGSAHASNREIVSYGGTRPPPAPYSAPFNFAYQNFVAASNRIMKLGVVVGNAAAAVHKPAVPQEVELLLCTSRTCDKTVLGRGKGSIVNYGVTEVELEAVADVVVGREYFVYWNAPAAYEATPWVTFWRGSGPKPEDAEHLQVLVRGFDAGSETFHRTFTNETAETSIATFSSYENASGSGAEIGVGQTVQVSCKVFGPEIASVEPEGYWYRIHSLPWNDEFYAAANAFENNIEGKKDVNTDFGVPDC